MINFSEMSLQWSLVATFLYMEVAAIGILLLPFISPTRWNKIFKSKLVTSLASYSSIYFNVILVALSLLLLDAIREISIYKTRLGTSNDANHGHLHYGPTMELVKEFRAQRNFYISGTALFLWFVFKRMLALISNAAHLIAENTAIKSQAESANKTASLLLSQDLNKQKQSKSSDTASTELTEKLVSKCEEVDTLQNALKSAKLDVETMKKQSESVTKEYDLLLKGHAKLQAKLEQMEYLEGRGRKNN